MINTCKKKGKFGKHCWPTTTVIL